MTAVLISVIAVLAIALGALAVRHRAVAAPSASTDAPDRRILFPFTATTLSSRALDAALRLARAEDAAIVPVFLAEVPLTLPLDTPLPRQAGLAIALQEAIEHRAAHFGVPVDARIERGRSYRHALRQTIDHERFDRIVVAATLGRRGLDADDMAWLLQNAPGEIIVLRPGADDVIAPVGPAVPVRRRRTRGAAAGERLRPPVRH